MFFGLSCWTGSVRDRQGSTADLTESNELRSHPSTASTTRTIEPKASTAITINEKPINKKKSHKTLAGVKTTTK